MKVFVVLLFLLASSSVVAKNRFDYQLQPQKIAKDTYVFIGVKEDLTSDNGGNIVNTAFIVTTDGVIVIDTGPSYIYGKQMRAAIQSVTDKPVIKILLTHHHPDHIFGNQAFADVPVYALPDTLSLIKRDAPAFLDNMYRMVGYWMSDTELTQNIKPLELETESFSDHQLRYLSVTGHTDADLIIFDESTGVLFAGDVVFHNRALTTPHIDIDALRSTLNELLQMNYTLIVPGHGEVSDSMAPIEQTLAYLDWLEVTLRESVADGLDMNEALQIPIPDQFAGMGNIQREYTRSVTHLYPRFEKELLDF